MKFENKEKLYFASDAHFGHSNVIKFDNRPYDDIREMDEAIITNWNSVVKPNDIVFYAGDMCMRSPNYLKPIVDRLNGDIYVALGNHDRRRELEKLNRFKIIRDRLEINVLDNDGKEGRNYQHIVIDHYPLLVWNKHHRGSWLLHGHCHQSLKGTSIGDVYYTRKVEDIGLNGWNYTPPSYDQIKSVMNSRVIATIDHH